MEKRSEDLSRGFYVGGNIHGPAGIIFPPVGHQKGQVAAVRPLLF